MKKTDQLILLSILLKQNNSRKNMCSNMQPHFVKKYLTNGVIAQLHSEVLWKLCSNCVKTQLQIFLYPHAESLNWQGFQNHFAESLVCQQFQRNRTICKHALDFSDAA